MNRILQTFTLALLTFSSLLSASATVDLDAPGALGRLHEERPDHYQKVSKILQDAVRLPEKEIAGWVRTNYQAESVVLGEFLLVSSPPKRRLSFSLDSIPYEATVVVPLPSVAIVPAK